MIKDQLDLINKDSAQDRSRTQEILRTALSHFKDGFDEQMKSFKELQNQKFDSLEKHQADLVLKTEKQLDTIRETVDEKLNKTLNDRLSQTFKTVGQQLESVQQGLGEMKNLAQDVGGLKRVLSNVKNRGSMGEVQLQRLLEHLLAPAQYQSNVRINPHSTEQVEYAIVLPGRENDSPIFLPIDAKFPADTYEHLLNAYEEADQDRIKKAQDAFERAIKAMAKDISSKYVHPPYSTDFGIMFLPFEGLYAEVIRSPHLLETLQRDYHIIVTGPTTLAALLNSLQMGFRTLAIEKRSSEVWKTLASVKKEFANFGDLIEKARKNINTGMKQLDELGGVRTRAIERQLKEVSADEVVKKIKE
ncbi:MAG: DNA recombination protein RmuC [Cyclobacteriaceae bacterium]|nr:DNA recombination protein RmuC [Cyclobacteriaceae bacterium]